MGQASSNYLSTRSELVDTETGVEFTINQIKYSVPKLTRPDFTLNDFIRNVAKLKGTKYMCLEGGCGVCIVAVRIKNNVLSVNSCIVPIILCNGWDVITIEGIRGKLVDYNPLQKTLADTNGSQCGFCSPAMIMNMYSLVARGKTSRCEIEDSFGSNICRCTGYRSILDAFQMFSNDSVDFHDIEDSHKSIVCSKRCSTSEDDSNDFDIVDILERKPIYLKLKDAEFFKIFSVQQIFQIFNKYPDCAYILNGGNTGNGVRRITKKNVYIDINGVTELQRVSKTASRLVLGSGVTLEEAKDCFHKYSKDSGFEYLGQLANHVGRIGHASMRNIGTIAGNLMLKHRFRSYTSDLFLILETAGAQIHICMRDTLKSEGSKLSVNFIEFLDIDMKHKLIYSVVLSPLQSDYVYRTYKVMQRAQNSNGHVIAGFLFRLDGKSRVVEKPNIIFGGINPKFLHAEKTEEYLVGKCLLSKNALIEALNTLKSELQPDHVLPSSTPKYRKKLAQSLFYKFILSLKPDRINPKLRSGGRMLKRVISSGKTDYNVDKSTWPVNQPVRKVEALHQTSGEAEYVDDVPQRDNEVFCVLVLADAIGRISQIDPGKALAMDGVVAFYTAKDVPGKNVSIDKTSFFNYTDEPVNSHWI